MPLPVVAVVGRPNVGKSTFVNRIAQSTDAIVHEMRGVTRDRSYHRAEWNGVDFMLIDTGGIESGSDDEFQASIRSQALMAAEEADVIVVLTDGKSGVVAGDEDVAKHLRGVDKPTFLLVNKMDDPGNELAMHEFWSLGLGQPWAVSSTHGHGTGDLLDAIVDALPLLVPEDEDDSVHIAIIGRPNAGKSSLLNRLAGAERSIVSDVAGTTRDAIDTVVTREDRSYTLVDTAGLRRASKIDQSVEYYGFVRAMRAIDRADVALLVIDATVGVTDQDQRIARFAEERGCGLVIVLNKWDTMKGEEDARELIEARVTDRLAFVGFAPVLRISALTGTKVDRIWDAVDAAYSAYSSEVTTSALNRFLTDIREFGHTVSRGQKTLRINYVTQTGVKPPKFTFFCNHPTLVDDSFRRYLENRMRENFDFTGTPILFRFRPKGK